MQPESASVLTNAEGLGVAGRADNNLDNLQVVHVAQSLRQRKIALRARRCLGHDGARVRASARLADDMA